MIKPFIVIDPGHGGDDPGAVGPSGILEKDATISTAFYLLSFMLCWAHPYLVRRTDESVSLQKRSAISNSNDAILFVSLHFNGAESPAANGCEVLFFPGSEKGQKYACRLQKDIVSIFRGQDRGIKERGDLAVLRETVAPAILLEPAFITNPKEEYMVKQYAYQYALAKVINDAIREVF